MFVSFILLAFLVIFSFISNHREVRKRHPHSDFRVPLWPTFNSTKTIGKFLVLLYAPAFLPPALIILHARKTFTYRSGFIPLLWALGFTVVAFFTISIPVMYMYGELIITEDTFLKVMSSQSNDVTSVLIQLLYVFISMFHAPVYLFNGRESTILFFVHNFKCAR